MMQSNVGWEQKIRSVHALHIEQALGDRWHLLQSYPHRCWRIALMSSRSTRASEQSCVTKKTCLLQLGGYLTPCSLQCRTSLTRMGIGGSYDIESNAYAVRLDFCAIFTMPNFPQRRHATFLLTHTGSEAPDFSLEMEHPENSWRYVKEASTRSCWSGFCRKFVFFDFSKYMSSASERILLDNALGKPLCMLRKRCGIIGQLHRVGLALPVQYRLAMVR